MSKSKHFIPGAKRRGIAIAPWKAGAAMLAVLLLLYFAYTLLQPGITNISSMTPVSIKVNQTVLVSIYGGEPVAIRLHRASNFSTTFFITRLPVLYGPVSSVVLSAAVGANVSSNGTRIADMNLKLVSTSPSGATIQITPLPSTLAILTSSSITVLAPANFYTPAITNVTLTTTTTVASSSTTTSPSTTTIAQNSTAQLLQQALTLMNGTTVGILMRNYKALYVADAVCGRSTYNTTYFNNYYTSPPAYASYDNASLYTPRDLVISENTLPARNNVRITYSTVSPSSLSTGSALIATINTSALSYLKNVSYVGIYIGLNYTRLNSSYVFQRAIGNSCGAWIPPN